MRSSHAIAIDLGRRRVRGLLGQVSAGRGMVRVKRLMVEEYPPDLNADDPQAVGHWLKERLSVHKFSGGRATIAIAREHVGLKRMTLPTVDQAELPDMTRLAMQRELPFDADTAVIDFMPVEQTASGTTVLAVAVPRTVIDFVGAMAKAAGLAIERISLRTMGAAALLNTMDQDDFGFSILDFGLEPEQQFTPEPNPKSKIQNPKSLSGLAIDVTGEGVEFCLVAGGSIRFSRAAQVPQPQDQLAIADAVVTETRRTWMSYQIAEGVGPVKVALVMGDRRVSEYAAAPLEQMLKIPVRVVDSHMCVDAAGHEMDRHWPLAGLLLEPGLSGELINFAHPRRAPDLAARTRQRRLAAAGIALVALMTLWTFARSHLKSLQAHATELAKQQQRQAPADARYRRDRDKLENLRQWESAQVDWLEHAAYLAEIAPPTNRVVLDSWKGTLEFGGVKFNPKTKKWSADKQLTIALDGEARDRETADAFRETLVQTSIYTTSSSGADAIGGKRMPYGFKYTLRTRAGSPGASETSSPASPVVTQTARQ